MISHRTKADRHLGLVASISLVAVTPASANVIHVTRAGSPAPTGETSAPYRVVHAGIKASTSATADTVLIEPGTYYEVFTTDWPSTLTADGGTVTIGRLDYQAATTVEVITLNTHLFGDVVGPSWQDYARADDIADSFGGANLSPDVVGFQEIWDEDLFFGGDGANGILPRSGYPYGDHGDEERGHLLNSGVALMSLHALLDFVQGEWDDCADFLECQTAKGWVQARIIKDGFPIGIFTLHTQAGSGGFPPATAEWVREQQILQLVDAIDSFRATYPDHVVFAFGDYNVYGETAEYHDVLIPHIGLEAGGYDADRNAPGFVEGSFESWTHCACNPLATHFDENAENARLDYIFYFPSHDGSVDVIPTLTHVYQFTGRTLTEDGLTTDQSSDHWAVRAQFRLVRP
jgi:hypothetical protein